MKCPNGDTSFSITIIKNDLVCSIFNTSTDVYLLYVLYLSILVCANEIVGAFVLTDDNKREILEII